MKNWCRVLSVMLVLVITVSSVSFSAYAAKPEEKGSFLCIEKGHPRSDDELYVNEGTVYFKFTVSISNDERSNGKDGALIEITGASSYEKYKCLIPRDDWTAECYIYCDSEEDDEFTVTCSALTNKNVDCEYKMYHFNNIMKSATVPKAIVVPTLYAEKLKISNVKPKNALPHVSFHFSNSKVAEGFIDTDGIYVYGKKQGKCTMTLKTDAGITYKVKVTVRNPKPRINYTSASWYQGEKHALKINYTKKKPRWKSSNPKVATVSKNGIVKTKGVGKCVITGKIGKKTYKCKIKVTRRTPNFGAILTDYQTRSNRFEVIFYNYSGKPVTIESKNSRAIDDDYKSWDRYLKLSDNEAVRIPAKTKKKVYFYVKGDYAWNDYEDYTIQYQFNYDGKAYIGRCWYYDCSYRVGKKWYGTYWTNYETRYQQSVNLCNDYDYDIDYDD